MGTEEACVVRWCPNHVFPKQCTIWKFCKCRLGGADDPFVPHDNRGRRAHNQIRPVVGMQTVNPARLPNVVGYAKDIVWGILPAVVKLWQEGHLACAVVEANNMFGFCKEQPTGAKNACDMAEYREGSKDVSKGQQQQDDGQNHHQ